MNTSVICLTVLLLLPAAVIAQTNHGQTDTPVKILFRPKTEYPKSDGASVCIRGTVTLKVKFLASGEIGNILPITRLPYGATENAVAVARKIKFRPATKDGIPITKTLTVQFYFGED